VGVLLSLPFRQKQIPEITGLKVLIKYRRQGIASALMEEAEHLISQNSLEAGIGSASPVIMAPPSGSIYKGV
jgi:N-acetylglutamate synthase-like GNAT family acetyltransferase